MNRDTNKEIEWSIENPMGFVDDGIGNLIAEYSKEIATQKVKILDDFTKAYLSSRWNEYFSKNTNRIRRLVLVEQRTNDPLKTEYYFKIKRGRYAKN